MLVNLPRLLLQKNSDLFLWIYKSERIFGHKKKIGYKKVEMKRRVDFDIGQSNRITKAI